MILRFIYFSTKHFLYVRPIKKFIKDIFKYSDRFIVIGGVYRVKNAETAENLC